MPVQTEELNISSSSEDYWKINPEKALDLTLKCYHERELENSTVYESLGEYFTTVYGQDVDRSDLETDIEKEAFDIYTLLDLTDESMDPIRIEEILGC